MLQSYHSCSLKQFSFQSLNNTSVLQKRLFCTDGTKQDLVWFGRYMIVCAANQRQETELCSTNNRRDIELLHVIRQNIYFSW